MAATQDPFEALLSWLDRHDREAAGRTYESIRTGLLQILISKGFSNAEDLADEVIERVTRRLPEIAPTYQGRPANYFYGVLRNIIKEQWDVKEIATDDFSFTVIKPEKTNEAYNCLRKCLTFLPHDKRELILDYYVYTGSEKIRGHNEMADELGISENALRIRAFRIRTTLEECVYKCLSANRNETHRGYHEKRNRSLPRVVSEHGSS